MSFWDGVNASYSWLRERFAATSVAWRARPASIALGVVAIVAFGVVSYRYSPEIRYWMTRAHAGQIIVNSPTVYTRQRLVNDRLNQTSWLREQLKLAENSNSAQFRIIDQVQTRVEQSTTRGGVAGNTSGAAPAAAIAAETSGLSQAKDDTPAAADLFSVQPTTAALFRAKNAFRDEVRSEMTQTQLDDRHDIKGNTIYRLAFDATVIAGSKKNAVAAVKITLGHHPYVDKKVPKQEARWWQLFGSKAVDEKTLVQAETLKRLYMQDYEELYSDWLRNTQEQTSASISSITQSFLGRDPDPSARLLFSRFLLGRLCEFATGRTVQDENIHPDCDIVAKSADPDRARKNHDLTTKILNKYIEGRFAELRTESLKRIKGELQVQNNKADPEAVHTAAAGICRYYKGRTFVPLWEIGFQLQSEAQQASADGKIPPFVRCPFLESLGDRLLASISLYSQLHEYASTVSASERRSDVIDEDKIALALSSTKSNRLDEPHPVQCFAGDFLKAKLNAFDRQNPKPWERIGYFFRLEMIGRELQDCQILIKGNPKERIHDAAKAALSEEMKFILNQTTEIFSYSVSPKNLAENISTASQTRDAFEILAKYGFRAGNNDANAFASRLNDRSERLQGVLSHPMLVGFASGRHAPETFSDPSSPDRTTSAIRQTSFGWLVAPRSRGSDALEQIDGQYALTAVISVPSWWRSVEAEIETCWIAREDLSKVDDQRDGINICDGQSGKRDRTVVRLPGAIQELSRKLGFEVIEQPYLRSEPRIPELEIGQPGSLLLKGGRLWRSTEVTLGAQRATGITVLPNMEGIIATFKCVLPQQGENRLEKDSLERTEGRRRITQTEVRVWTSEGVTKQVLVDLVWPEAKAEPTTKAEQVKWCPQYPEVFSVQ